MLIPQELQLSRTKCVLIDKNKNNVYFTRL